MGMLEYVGIACGAGFVAYCIYFDQKRRSAPDYKQKVMERRLREKREREAADSSINLPDLTNKIEVEKFFMEGLAKGQELIDRGDIDQGVKHLSVAIIISGQAQQMMAYLQESLPPKVTEKLIQALPEANKLIKRHANPEIDPSKSIVEEDVE